MLLTRQRNPARTTPRFQRGAVFYAFIVIVIAIMAALAVGIAGMQASRQFSAQQAARILEVSRELVLANLSQPDLVGSGGRLGQFDRSPDLPIAAGAGADALEPSFDGSGEVTGCAYRGWSVGQPLTPVSTSGANARCFGRMHWRELGLPFVDGSASDQSGSIPWLIVSPNLLIDQVCLTDLNPMIIGQPFSGYACPARQPFPWITVVDARGNLLSDRVAFALLLPGPALPGQNRSVATGPGDYLDSITIRPDCLAPCRPGTYDNAGFNHNNNQPWVLINASGSGPLVNNTATYQSPVHFNDRLIYVTADELFEVLESRALQTVTSQLQTFHDDNGYYPFVAPFSSASGDCMAGERFGHLPSQPGNCGAAEHLNLPSALVRSGWHRYFIYAVSSRCIAGNAACAAPGLTVDSRNDVNAIVFSPGSPRTIAPYTASRGVVQQPVNAVGDLSPLAADWLDSIENAGGTPDQFETPTSAADTDNDRLYAIY